MAGAEKHYIMPRAEFDKPVKLAIVMSPYYKDIADNMVAGAVAEIEAAGGTYEIVEVPGALEIPTAIGIADRKSNFDGYVALGCVIRGETTHYDYVCGESAKGLMYLSTDRRLAIGYGILTVENEAQALARAERSQKNKGRDAAIACLEMLKLRKKFVR